MPAVPRAVVSRRQQGPGHVDDPVCGEPWVDRAVSLTTFDDRGDAAVGLAVALARALLAHPEVLLLDEATAQIDGLTESAVHQVIREQASVGAVLTIAHRLSTVVDADTIVVVNQGQVVDLGRHEDLLTRCALHRSLVDSLRLNRAYSGGASA